MKETTSDTIALRAAGIVSIMQPKTGHRFTLDSLLLADFCRIKPHDRILEPGAGPGIISLLLARKYPTARIIADEVEPHAYELLCRNIEQNSLVDNIVPLDRDLLDLAKSLTLQSFDVLVANPPYGKTGSGRTSPSLARQTARHDHTASLSDWLNLQTLLKNKGKYFLVFPAQRATELLSFLREKNLEPKRLRFVHSQMKKPASLILLEAVKNGGCNTDILPPLFVHDEAGNYSEELIEIYGTNSVRPQ